MSDKINSNKRGKWTAPWADISVFGYDDRDKDSIIEFVKFIANNYGLIGRYTGYDDQGFPEIEFVGDINQIKKLILIEYIGGDKYTAEDEYEWIEELN